MIITDTVVQLLQQYQEKMNTQTKSEEVLKTDLYNCDKCFGSGYIWKDYYQLPTKCSCFMNEINQKEKERMEEIFSSMYKNCTFDNYKIENDWQRKVYDSAKKYLELPNDFSYSILGQSGCGKTHIVVSIAKEMIKKGRNVQMMIYPEFMLRIKSKLGCDGGYDENIKPYKYADVLIIDDLFKGAVKNSKPNETELSIMFDLIDYRYRAQKIH